MSERQEVRLSAVKEKESRILLANDLHYGVLQTLGVQVQSLEE